MVEKLFNKRTFYAFMVSFDFAAAGKPNLINMDAKEVVVAIPDAWKIDEGQLGLHSGEA